MMADYGVEWSCVWRESSKKNTKTQSRAITRNNTKIAKFYTPMFFSEGAFGLGSKPYHQTSIDILGLPNSQDGILSTTMFYDDKNSRLGIYNLEMSKESVQKQFIKWKVPNLKQLLRSAVELSFLNWDAKMWKALFLLKNSE